MSPLFIKEFGALMKATRLKRKLSYEQLSEKMECPKAKSTLKRYEDGVAKKLDYLTIRDICDVLMLDVNKFSVCARPCRYLRFSAFFCIFDLGFAHFFIFGYQNGITLA